MRAILWCLLLALLATLTACAATPDRAKMEAFYNKFDKHCREHARDMLAEYDEQERYDECMSYFINTDLECPTCTVDSHLSGPK